MTQNIGSASGDAEARNYDAESLKWLREQAAGWVSNEARLTLYLGNLNGLEHSLNAWKVRAVNAEAALARIYDLIPAGNAPTYVESAILTVLGEVGFAVEVTER